MKHYPAKYIARKTLDRCQHVGPMQPWIGNTANYKSFVMDCFPSGWRKNERTRHIMSRVINTYLGLGQTTYRGWAYHTRHITREG